MPIIELPRGETLRCSRCVQTGTITHKGALPLGWQILTHMQKGSLVVETFCPQCNAADVARWNPSATVTA